MPSRSQTSVERLTVYANAYYARLIECLEEEFPGTAYALGEETFRAFAVDYLQRHPPHSYTLAKLAADFPRYLRETRPVEGDSGSGAASVTDFLVDLATLERTYAEVFDSPGVEGRRALPREDLAAIPSGQWADVRLTPVPCLRLLELRFPAQEFAAAVKQGRRPSIPPASATYLIVTRRNFIVRPRAISLLEYQALQGLCERRSIGEVASLAAQSCNCDTERLSLQLSGWFRRWAEDGLFIDIGISSLS